MSSQHEVSGEQRKTSAPGPSHFESENDAATRLCSCHRDGMLRPSWCRGIGSFLHLVTQVCQVDVSSFAGIRGMLSGNRGMLRGMLNWHIPLGIALRRLGLQLIAGCCGMCSGVSPCARYASCARPPVCARAPARVELTSRDIPQSSKNGFTPTSVARDVEF